MSAFADIGRMMLEATIAGKLSVHAGDVNVPELVEAFVAKWGFVDIDEVPQGEFWFLVAQHAAKPVE